MVYLGWLNHAEEFDEGHGVAHVGVVEMKVWPAFEVCDTFAEIDGGTADDAMHLVAFLKEELGKVRAILPCNACNKGNVPFVVHSLIEWKKCLQSPTYWYE
jgi:hypothetical protein